MRVMAMLLLLSSSRVCAESISGVWSLNQHKSTKALSRPIAIEIEQAVDHLDILQIVTDSRGKYVENTSVNPADIRSTHANILMTVPSSTETWTLRKSGELVIKRKTGRHRSERFVFDHAKELVQFGDTGKEGVVK